MGNSNNNKLDTSDSMMLDDKAGVMSYSIGDIAYTFINEKLTITNITINIEKKAKDKNVLVLPERLFGIDIFSISVNSLNELRKQKIKYLILPNTIHQIGEKNINLYKDYPPKTFTSKVKMFYSFEDYSRCDWDIFYNAYKERKEDMFFINIEDKDLTNDFESYFPVSYFCPLADLQNKEGFWEYPKDNCWIIDDEFIKYTGTANKIVVNNSIVRERAFLGIDSLKEIIFGSNIQYIEGNCISNCKMLKKIKFESEIVHNIGLFSVHDCINLKEIIWPNIIGNNDHSFYYNCPFLGNMIQNGVLLTWQTGEEIINVENNITRIATGAFKSCKNSKIIIIPENVETVGGIVNGYFEYIVFIGRYTSWTPPVSSGTELYIYAYEESNPFSSISPYVSYTNIYFKKLEQLNICIDMENGTNKRLRLKPNYIVSDTNSTYIYDKCKIIKDKKSDDCKFRLNGLPISLQTV